MIDVGTTHRSTILACLTFAIMIAGATVKSYYEPDWNFDAVPYVALAYSLTNDDPREIHRRTFDDFLAAVPSHAFELLTSGSEYRRRLYASPEALKTQRPFYINKPAYVVLIAGLRQLGINAARATRVISLAGFVSVAMVVLLWLWTVRAKAMLVVSAALFLCAPPFTEMASLSSPDMIAALPLVIAAWLMLGRGRQVRGILCACAAIFFRPDASIAVLLLATWATFFAPSRRLRIKTFVMTCAAIVVGTFVLQKATGATSLPTLLRHTFESRLYEPSRMSEAISIVGYFTVLFRGLGSSLYHPSVLPLHLAMSLIAILALAKCGTPSRPFWGWMLLAWTYAPLHYLVFPDPSDRLFAPAYLLAGLGVIFLPIELVQY